jgi:hypothetical protein
MHQHSMFHSCPPSKNFRPKLIQAGIKKEGKGKKIFPYIFSQVVEIVEYTDNCGFCLMSYV